MKFCPRCKQGEHISRYFLPTLRREVFVCYECEALYETLADIEQVRFEDCHTYLQRHGGSEDYTTMVRRDDEL